MDAGKQMISIKTPLPKSVIKANEYFCVLSTLTTSSHCTTKWTDDASPSTLKINELILISHNVHESMANNCNSKTKTGKGFDSVFVVNFCVWTTWICVSSYGWIIYTLKSFLMHWRLLRLSGNVALFSQCSISYSGFLNQ